VPSESEIEAAYQESVKQWHPDLYKDYASLRAEAEERFEQIQLAYRELKEHFGAGGSTPVRASSAPSAQSASYAPSVPYFETAQPVSEPELSFGGAPGCLIAAQFNSEIKEMIAGHMGSQDKAMAIVDLGGSHARFASYAQFLLIGNRGIMVRNARNIVSLLWYKDLGELRWTEGQSGSKSGNWQKFIGNLSGGSGGCQLAIYRSDGALFLSLTDQVEDGVKRTLYNFFLGKKAQA
jgi:hypothetical protein